MEAAAGCFGALLLVFIAIAFVIAVQANNRANALKRELERQQTTIEYLGKRLSDLRTELHATRGETPPQPAPEPQPTPEPEPLPQPTPEPLPQTEPEPLPDVEPEPQPVTEPLPEPIAARVATAPDETEAAAFESTPQPESAESQAPPPPPTAPPRPPKPRFDWEGLIGVKLFSWIAGIALVLAAVFFLRYSVEHGWLGPSMRATIGIVTGIALIVICELRVARDYKVTANSMHGAAIAILFATLFATHALWHLLSAGVVFALMTLVTAVAVGLSIRRDSVFIALLGLVGGFSTPAMLSTGENRPIGLFSYLLLLNAGLAWVAYKKRWPHLTALSLLFTVIYQWGWTAKFLSASQLPLAAGIFALFAVVAASSFWASRAELTYDRRQELFDRIGLAGAALPLVFAAFTATVPAYGARYNILFGFLLFIAGGLAFIAARRGPDWLHLLGGIATLLTFVLWFTRSYVAYAYPTVLAWVVVFVLLYLVAHVAVAFRGPNAHAVRVAGVLLFAFPVLAAIEPRAASPALLFGVLFIALAAIAGVAIYRNAGTAYFIGAFFAIAAEAVWSAKYLTDARLIPALTLYAVFALFYLGVPILARRFDRPLAPRGGTAAVLIAAVVLLFFLAQTDVANAALWGIALMLMILNAGAFFEGRHMRMPLLTVVVSVLSWIVLAVWCVIAQITVQLVPALFVIGGFALVVLAGNVWSARGADDAKPYGDSTWIALAGHVFLLFIATREALANPPWPLLAVLFVLDLAIGAASLWLRDGRLFIGAIAASQAVLFAFASSIRSRAIVASWSAVAVAALAFVWIALAARRGADRAHFARATAVGLFAATLVILATNTASFALQLSTQLLVLLGFLALSWIMEWHALAVGAVFSTALATFSLSGDQAHTPLQSLIFAATMYVPLLVYPLALGNRAKQRLLPFAAALLASIPFFFSAKQAVTALGLGYAIGIVPVAQAALMVVLLVHLLRLEPPGERMLARLALVAAAALAFVTVAIPLQLEKQWITIGWALEGAALVWLFTRIPHRGLLAWAGALLAAAFVRLTLNPAVWSYHPSSSLKIVNWYLYTYLVAAAAMFFAARLLPADERARSRFAVPALSTMGGVLLFFLLNIEIADFYSTGPAVTFNFFSSSLAQDLTYTIFWALFAIGMLVTGLVLHARSARVAALLLLVVTILKCFLHDLARLGGLYRVVSLLGLAMSLVLVGILLQRFVMMKPREEPS